MSEILKSPPLQFSLSDSAEILWQPKLGNPLPGIPVARIAKGEKALSPVVIVEENAVPVGADMGEFERFFAEILRTKLASTLEPLVALEAANSDESLPAPVREIIGYVYDAMGIVPRETLETVIALLDADGRRALRQKGISLGPVLVFMPALNKPAAVRLRALLWAVFHGISLPVAIPRDGVVSQKIEGMDIDPDFYRAIGYPVYGPRAIRIDMLDRLISAVYTVANKGIFEAQHQMAEWLGCGIQDLYAVLEAMGHHKISDPAEQAPAPVQAEIPVQDTPQTEASAAPAEPAAEQANTPQDSSPAPAPEEKKPQTKPPLATFRLKRGKAFEDKKPTPQRTPRPPREKKEHEGQKNHKERRDFKNHKDKKERRDRDERRFKKQEHAQKNRGEGEDPNFRIVSSSGPAPKKEDSPFAILESLKAGMGDKR